MAAPPDKVTIAPAEISVSVDDNLTVTGKTVSVKTAYFKFGSGVDTNDTVMEIITKDTKDIQVNDQIPLKDGNSYVITEIDRTNVEFASGTPLVTRTTNVRFPRPEAKTYAPEKVATFLIFKK